jgi:hypothetical protein
MLKRWMFIMVEKDEHYGKLLQNLEETQEELRSWIRAESLVCSWLETHEVERR